MIFFSINVSLLVACKNTEIIEIQSHDEAILFASDREGEELFYLMTPDGENVQIIDIAELSSEARIERPVWSRKTQKFYFIATINTKSDIFSMGADGSDLENLTNTVDRNESSLTLSTDEEWIAFLGSANGNGNDIYIMKTDGSKPSNVTQRPVKWYRDLSWSPDNKSIYFSSPRSGSPNVYAIGKDGTGLVNISKGPGLDGKYSLSPDGKSIAFDSDRELYNDIFTINVLGGNTTNLTNSNYVRDREPVWSPDGKYIAYRSVQDDQVDIFIIDLEYDTITNLTQTPRIPEMTFSWSPGSDFLIYVTVINDQLDIYKIGIEDSKPINLSNNPTSNDYLPLWNEK